MILSYGVKCGRPEYARFRGARTPVSSFWLVGADNGADIDKHPVAVGNKCVQCRIVDDINLSGMKVTPAALKTGRKASDAKKISVSSSEIREMAAAVPEFKTDSSTRLHASFLKFPRALIIR